MSSLWTPSGEHRVEREDTTPSPTPPPPTEALTEEEAEAQASVAELRERLANTPAETVIANHCYGLFELGAIYLSVTPPQIEEARLAIDSLGLLVEGLGERLGETAAPLRDALAQLRLGFVQISAAQQADEGEAAPGTADQG